MVECHEQERSRLKRLDLQKRISNDGCVVKQDINWTFNIPVVLLLELVFTAAAYFHWLAARLPWSAPLTPHVSQALARSSRGSRRERLVAVFFPELWLPGSNLVFSGRWFLEVGPHTPRAVWICCMEMAC